MQRLSAAIDEALVDEIKQRFRFFGGNAAVMQMDMASREFREGMLLLKQCHAEARTIVAEVFD